MLLDPAQQLFGFFVPFGEEQDGGRRPKERDVQAVGQHQPGEAQLPRFEHEQLERDRASSRSTMLLRRPQRKGQPLGGGGVVDPDVRAPRSRRPSAGT